MLVCKRRLEAAPPSPKALDKEGSSFLRCSLAAAHGKADGTTREGTGWSPGQKAPLLPSDKGRCPIKAEAEAERPGEGAHGQPTAAATARAPSSWQEGTWT